MYSGFRERDSRAWDFALKNLWEKIGHSISTSVEKINDEGR